MARRGRHPRARQAPLIIHESDDTLLCSRKVAAILGVSTEVSDRLLRRGLIPGVVDVGRGTHHHRRVRYGDLEAYLRAQADA